MSQTEKNSQDDKIMRNDLGLPGPYIGPTNDVETELCHIWEEILNMHLVGIEDDFFFLGGDSLAAVMLASEIEKQFGIRFSPSEIMQYSTVALQAMYCTSIRNDEGIDPKLPGFVTGINTGGGKQPIFFIHGGAGFILIKHRFFRQLGDDQPVYMFQAPGVDGHDKPLTSIESLASTYKGVLLDLLPEGPWIIVVSCAGSLIAIEMCRLMAAEGKSVNKLILIDPVVAPPKIADKYPMSHQVDVKRNLKGLSAYVGSAFHVLFSYVRPGSGDGREFKETSSYTGDLAHMRSMIKRARHHKRLLGGINKFRSGINPFSSDQALSYNPDHMLAAAMALYDAKIAYIPKPLEGVNSVIICGKQRKAESEIDGRAFPFWQDYLSDVEIITLNAGHDELFKDDAVLDELAGQVTAVLSGNR